MNEPSIYTKIINGEMPSHKVYEDDKTYAFLDIYPVQPGMTLVVTKKQVEDFTQLGSEDLCALMDAVQKVARRMKEVFPEKKRIGVQIEGLDVPHVHVKIFPIDTGPEFRAEPDRSVEPDHEGLAKIAEKLRFK
jgi:histidine triad (HIT) family protein